MKKRLVYVSSEAGGLKCECGEKLAHFDLVTPVENRDGSEGETRKKLLCCTRASCDNSAKMTAKIHKAELLVGGQKP